MGERFKVRANGCGGWTVRDTSTRREGSDMSHRRNAEIAAGRCNYGGAGESADYWRGYYRLT